MPLGFSLCHYITSEQIIPYPILLRNVENCPKTRCAICTSFCLYYIAQR
nr:MAG TPA: hypothetical protein [Caudoviricetes sp.]DAO51455.1 MAG TPA: hypothetical protein [Caudoviricetes sp.]